MNKTFGTKPDSRHFFSAEIMLDKVSMGKISPTVDRVTIFSFFRFPNKEGVDLATKAIKLLRLGSTLIPRGE